MYIDNLTAIDKVLVRKEVFETPFVCDLKKCKGACCTLESSYGAPLRKEEIPEIEKNLPEILKHVPETSRNFIEIEGFWEEKEGEYFTKSIDDKDCVFVYYEDKIAKCGIEKAFKEGRINFVKPISCHLFPIRISKFGSDVLRYEKFSQCEPALDNGKKLKVTIPEFCKDSLTRLYGSSWYEKLRDYFRR